MSYPNTYDQPEEISLLPNWAAGITCMYEYKTAVITSMSGWEQSVRHKSRVLNSYKFMRDTTSDSDNEKLSFNRVSQAYKPIKMPLWGHGVALRIPQTIEGEVNCDFGVPTEIAISSRIFIYDYQVGGVWRTVTDIQNERRRLTLEEDLTAPLFPLGAWVFPTAIGTLSLTDAARTITQTRASTESLTFNGI